MGEEMKTLALVLSACLLLAFAQVEYQTSTNPAPQLEETRYCGAPVRYASGTIKRSTAVLRAFRGAHPCPASGATEGACPGWAIDHVIPLAVGGCDAVSNLQWLPDRIKSSKDIAAKDRWERKIYATPMITVEVQ